MSATPAAPTPGAAEAPAAAPDPFAVMKSKSYASLLVLSALIGVPISALSYLFLRLVEQLQTWCYGPLPSDLGFHTTPNWWSIPLLVVAGLLVGLTIHFLPGTGGHEPSAGLVMGGTPTTAELPAVFFAALASLALGAVVGPEAPLIALGGGLGALAVHLAKKDAPPMAATVIAAAGSFAAVATLLGSPLLGAFLLMEAAGLSGPTLGIVLVPGLLAAGVGSLIFVGMDAWTGWGSVSLAIPGLPAFHHITGVMFLYAVAFGLLAPFLGFAIRIPAQWLALRVQAHRVALSPIMGLGVGLCALLFAVITHRSAETVLFSGQSGLGPLVDHASGWTISALLVLILAKAVAYSLSLSAFRGGPVFPALFIGTAVGIAAGHLPGLSMVPAIGMGIGVMATVMLRLPLTSVLLATIILAADGASAMPLVVVGVAVAYATMAWLPQSLSELTAAKTTAATVTP